MIYKVLYVIDNIEFGGGERVFSQLINRLSRDRYRVIVACSRGDIFEEKIKDSGAQLEHVEMGNRFNPWPILQLARLMRRERLEIVHSQGGRADFFARMAARWTRVPIVVSTIAMPVEGYDVNPIKRFIYALLDRFSERLVDRFIVVSRALEQTLIKRHRIKRNKIVIIHNGIEIEEYKPVKDRARNNVYGLKRGMGSGDEGTVVGAIGRLVWQKGLEHLIEAVPLVIKEFPEARFLIVGEGPLRETLMVKSDRLGVKEKVLFTGFRRDIKDILAAIDILVMPSLREGLPMILLEAMAMAKPIIATDIEGVREVLDNGRTGLLVSPGSPIALSRAITDLLVHRDKACQMGLAARKTAETRFSVDSMVAGVERVYQGLLREKIYGLKIS